MKNINWILEKIKDSWIEEETAYTGKHWVKCYLVRGRTIIAESKKFYINVW